MKATARAVHRANLLQQLSAALYQDQRLVGLVLVGSGADGFRDDESDIDLVAPVADESAVAAVFRDWKERIEDVVTVRYRAETAFTEQHQLLVLFCDGQIEIDLSFPTIATLRPLSTRWKVLWERTTEVTQKMASPEPRPALAFEQRYLWSVNRAVHRVIYAAKALRRAQHWRALLLLDELRARVLQLISLDLFGELYSDALGDDGIERHVDALPPPVIAQLAQTLPRTPDQDAIRQSLLACVELLLFHTTTLDQRYGMAQSEALRALFESYLKFDTNV